MSFEIWKISTNFAPSLSTVSYTHLDVYKRQLPISSSDKLMVKFGHEYAEEGENLIVIPEEIAVQKLFLHQAKLDSIEVSEAEIIQRVDMLTLSLIHILDGY